MLLEVYIFEPISALEHARIFILSTAVMFCYVLLGCINIIYKYGHAWTI